MGTKVDGPLVKKIEVSGELRVMAADGSSDRADQGFPLHARLLFTDVAA